MNATKISTLVFAACLILFAIFLTGCETLGISLQTDYGRFTYEIPNPITLRDK